MSRFKSLFKTNKQRGKQVSIHPMCRFKSKDEMIDIDKACLFQYILCVGSSSSGVWQPLVFFLFQYILCVGSSKLNLNKYLFQTCFNTSYVSVQAIGSVDSLVKLTEFQYILCVGSSWLKTFDGKQPHVSIHPMCRFKVISAQPFIFASGFQYILCVGSS